MNDEREEEEKEEGEEKEKEEEGGGAAPHPCCATKGGALRNSHYLLPFSALEYTGASLRTLPIHFSRFKRTLESRNEHLEKSSHTSLAHGPARSFHRSAPDSHVSTGAPTPLNPELYNCQIPDKWRKTTATLESDYRPSAAPTSRITHLLKMPVT